MQDSGNTKCVVLLMALLTAGGTTGVVILAGMVSPVIALSAPVVVGATLTTLALAALRLVNAFPAQHPRRGARQGWL